MTLTKFIEFNTEYDTDIDCVDLDIEFDIDSTLTMFFVVEFVADNVFEIDFDMTLTLNLIYVSCKKERTLILTSIVIIRP